LAGVLGDTESRIFCSDLQAELISIAGIYQLSDDLDAETAHKPVQVSLENQTLIIKDI
jgi:septum site-determining protein MinC